MSTTFPRASRGRTGSLNRCESPLSVSPSTSYVDLSRLSGSQQRSRAGWAKQAADQVVSQTAPTNFKLGFEPARKQAFSSSRASPALSSGLLKQALETQLSQSASSDRGAQHLNSIEARLRSRLASSEVHESSSKWQEAKKLAQNKVLLHPMVRKAHIIASTVHSGKEAHGCSEVMLHLEESALIVAQLGMDSTAVSAALLHEVLDSGELSTDALRKHTSDAICSIVMGVAKASRTVALYGATQGLQTQANTEKLLAVLVALGDVRVMLIKLAGRLQQARSMHQLPAEKREQFLLVTERLFIPVANRLGIWAIKAELEDLCFQASERQTWSELKGAVDHMLRSSQGTIAEFSHDALRELRAADIAVEDVEGRPKSLRSICSKLRRKGDGSVQSLQDVHDVLAVRIIVRSKAECYDAMQRLSQRWPAMPGREKNYIHSPKANGYRSLHNVLLSDSGMPVEVQVRTPAMHWNAEYGVASHWAYKEGAARTPEDQEETQPAADDIVTQAHAQLVAWARMVLTYGHGMRDHRVTSSTQHLRARSTLSGVTHALMAATAHAEVDNAELDRRRRDVPQIPRTHSSTSGAEPRTLSDQHSSVGSHSRRRKSFEDYVAASVQPPALHNVLVPVTWAGGAIVCALDAVLGASSVDKLLRSSASLAGVSCARVLVNGSPALGPTQPLMMGDCVQIVPAGERAAAAAVAPHRYLATPPTPLVTLRRDMMRGLCSAA